MIVGLTGILGSGKSVVADKLRQLGACIVDMDDAGRWVVEHDRQVKQGIKEAFGHDLFNEQDQLFRKKLGDIVFSDPTALARLNAIVHPAMLDRVRQYLLGGKRGKNCLYIVVDAALVFELDFQKECDRVVTVTAPIEMCLKRAEQFKNLTQAQALDRIQSQIPQQEKAKRSDYVLQNDAGFDELYESVHTLHRWLLQYAKE